MDKRILAIPLSLILIATILYGIRTDGIILKIAYAQPCDDNCPDAYDNKIANLTIWQWNGTNWLACSPIYWDTNYSCPTGFDITGTAAQATRFNVTVWLNVTLATDSADAVTKTRVYITLETGNWGSGTFVAGWNTRLMDDDSTNGNIGATHYWVEYREEWAAGPVAGTVYYVTIDYDSWY